MVPLVSAGVPIGAPKLQLSVPWCPMVPHLVPNWCLAVSAALGPLLLCGASRQSGAHTVLASGSSKGVVPQIMVPSWFQMCVLKGQHVAHLVSGLCPQRATWCPIGFQMCVLIWQHGAQLVSDVCPHRATPASLR